MKLKYLLLSGLLLVASTASAITLYDCGRGYLQTEECQGTDREDKQ